MYDFLSTYFSNAWQLLTTPLILGFSPSVIFIAIFIFGLISVLIRFVVSGSFSGSSVSGGNNSKISVSSSRKGDTR